MRPGSEPAVWKGIPMNTQENAREQTARQGEEAITILKEVVAHAGPGEFAGRLPDGARPP